MVFARQIQVIVWYGAVWGASYYEVCPGLVVIWHVLERLRAHQHLRWVRSTYKSIFHWLDANTGQYFIGMTQKIYVNISLALRKYMSIFRWHHTNICQYFYFIGITKIYVNISLA